MSNRNDYPGLRFMALFVSIFGLTLLLLSMFIPWVESDTKWTQSVEEYSGWRLVNGYQPTSQGGGNLTIELDDKIVFTGLTEIVLMPIILIVAILAVVFEKKKSTMYDLIILLISSLAIMVVSINNLVVIGGEYKGVGLYLNTLGAMMCFIGAIMAFSYRVRKLPEEVQAPEEAV
jgi:hypothetical protein